MCFQTEQFYKYGEKHVCEGFPGSLRQSIMGRVGPGTCRRGGRRGGEELMQGGAGKEMGGYGSPIKTLRKPAVGHLRNLPLSGSKII